MKEIKTVVFVSNFFNHHQAPLSDAMYAKLGDGFTFIETRPMSQERKNMGWGLAKLPAYVISSDTFQDNVAQCEEKIYQADVVIWGSAPYNLIKRRVKANRLIFVYSERPLKKGLEPLKYLYRLVRWHIRFPQNKSVYLLGASAYAAGDYRKFFLFQNRAYQWGYFPATRNYDDVEDLIQRKKHNSLIWVARYIAWKHPEVAIEVAKRLKQAGYSFELNMIGDGQLLGEISDLVKREGLTNEVHILGTMTPEEVREHMERAQIHLFTSDRNEGWGAVLNEAMNSACVPVADRAIGSVPFLVEDGENGYSYSCVDELFEKVKYLLEHKEEREAMAQKAYGTIVHEWNAEVAAEQLVFLAERILRGMSNTVFLESGPCGKI